MCPSPPPAAREEDNTATTTSLCGILRKYPSHILVIVVGLAGDGYFILVLVIAAAVIFHGILFYNDTSFLCFFVLAASRR